MYGLDISHWSYWDNNNRPPTQEQLEYCRDFANGEGVRWWSISISDQNIARQQIEAVARFPWPWPIEITTYRYYYWTNQRFAREADARFIDECRRNIYNVQWHWIDIEDNGVIQPVSANVADTNDLINFWAGKCRTGMYSAKWVWDILFGEYDGFNYMPLWYADWDWGERLTLDPGQEFGGWTRGKVKQTFGDFKFGGMLVDTNYLEEFMVPVVTEPPVDPFIEELKRLADEAFMHGAEISEHANGLVGVSQKLIADVAEIRRILEGSQK